jgi:hypothetical protein
MTKRIRPQQCAASQIWLTESEVAGRLGMSQKWLQKERLNGAGIPFAKFGAAVRYAISDIEAFERDSRRLSTSDLGQLSKEWRK